MSFHAKDGWHFTRVGDGVRITKRVPVFDANEHVVSGYTVVERVDLDEGTWNSVVASMTKDGENRETFDAARELHRGIVLTPDEHTAKLRELLHRIVSKAYGETSYPGRPTRTETDAQAVREAAAFLGFDTNVSIP